MAITTEQTIEKFKAVHGSRYSYCKVDYVSAKSKVKILCKIHGIFEQNPNNHLSGFGCPQCGQGRTASAKTKTKSQFLKEAKSIHGDTYDYKSVVYLGGKTRVEIRCKTHGKFYQTPNAHLVGKGCWDCSVDYRASIKHLTTEIFVERARKTHGLRYDYSRTDYVGMLENLSIRCRRHGYFTQNASAHLNGSGCPRCAKHGFNPKHPASFYIIETDMFVGYGITNNLEGRLRHHIRKLSLKAYPIKRIRFCCFSDGQDAFNFEKKIKQKTKCHVNVDVDGFRKEALQLRFLPNLINLIGKSCKLQNYR